MPRPRSGESPSSLREELLKNVPPNNLAAGQAILGGVLRKASLFDKLGVQPRRGDFSSPPASIGRPCRPCALG